MKYDQIIDVRLLAPSATGVAIVVSIILFTLNQRRKQLSWKLLSEDENSAVVQIINSGHLPIVPGDYHSPLAVSGGPATRLTSATVLSTVPGDLEDRCRTSGGERRKLIDRINGNEVLLSPVLLNDGDSITIRIMAEDYRGGAKVNGHINGVRRISVWRPKTAVFTALAIVGGLIMAFAVWCLEPEYIALYGAGEALPEVLLFLFGYTLLNAGLYGKKKTAATRLEPAV
jgi:hypothetical protein